VSDVDSLLGGLDLLIAKKATSSSRMQQLSPARPPPLHGEWEMKRLGNGGIARQNVVPASNPGQPYVHFSLRHFDSGGRRN